MKQESVKAKIDNHKCKKAQLILMALNHKIRKDIIDLIYAKPALTVSEIYKTLNIEQSVVSQHLAILKRAKVIGKNKDGKFSRYIVDKEKIKLIEKLSKELVA